MSRRQLTQTGMTMIILAGMLVVSGCSGGGEADRVEEDRASVAEASSTDTASSTTDPPISTIDAASSEIAEVEEVEPPPATDTATSTPPVEEPPPATDTATSTPPVEEPPPATDTATSTPPVEEPPPATDTATDAPEIDNPAEGKLVAVADTKPGLTRIGPTKCKICHKVQYASWAESKHAERTPPLDCESCHGSGSEYKKKSIMKDPELARAAGLVIPEKSFCVGGSCHQDDWQDDMLERAHAHKEDDAG